MANIAGFPGYNSWNDEAAAAADFAATGGRGKEARGGGGGDGGGGGGFQPISAPDFAKLEEQAFEMLKPYYLKVAQESRGDFNRAISILDEDYKIGVREAKETTDTGITRTNENLTSTLKDLGLTFKSEDEAKIDELNRRGMATTEAGLNQPLNVLTEGRGATEIQNLRSSQALRKEAVERAAKRGLEDFSTNLARYTSPNAEGKTSQQLAGMDRTKLGSAELGIVRGKEQATRDQQLREQQLFENRRREALGIADMFSRTADRKIATDLGKRYTENALTDFRERGI